MFAACVFCGNRGERLKRITRRKRKRENYGVLSFIEWVFENVSIKFTIGEATWCHHEQQSNAAAAKWIKALADFLWRIASFQSSSRGLRRFFRFILLILSFSRRLLLIEWSFLLFTFGCNQFLFVLHFEVSYLPSWHQIQDNMAADKAKFRELSSAFVTQFQASVFTDLIS